MCLLTDDRTKYTHKHIGIWLRHKRWNAISFCLVLPLQKNDTPRDEYSMESNPKSERLITHMFFFTVSYNKTAEMRLGGGKGLQARGEKNNRLWWWISLKHMI